MNKKDSEEQVDRVLGDTKQGEISIVANAGESRTGEDKDDSGTAVGTVSNTQGAQPEMLGNPSLLSATPTQRGEELLGDGRVFKRDHL